MKLSGSVIWFRFGLLVCLFSFFITPKNVWAENFPPVIGTGIPTQHAEVGSSFSYTIASDAFSDADYDNLTYSVNSASLPSGITFDKKTLTFSGTPQNGTAKTYWINVTASDPSGESATTGFKLVVHNNSTTEYAAFTMDVNRGCGNASVSFENKSKGMKSFVWTFGNGNGTKVIESPTAIYASAGMYIVTLSITSISGGTSTYTDTIFIYPKPSPSVIVDKTSGCEPLSLTLTEKSLRQTKPTIDSTLDSGQIIKPLTGGSYKYFYWNFHTKVSDVVTTDKTVTVDNIGSGSVNLVLTITDENGCQGSLYKPNLATVYGTPVAKFSYTKDETCRPDTVRFTNESTVSGSYISSQEWYIDDVLKTTTTNMKNKFTSTGSYAVGLEVTSAKGCKSDRYTDTVSFNNNNTADFTFENTCLDDYTTFTANVSSEITSVLWDFESDGETDATGESVSHRFQPTIDGIYDYPVDMKAVFNDGCVIETTKTVSINEIYPVIDISYANSCYPNVVINLSSSGSTVNYGSIVSRSWYLEPPNGDYEFFSSQTAPSLNKSNFPTVGTYWVMLKLESSNGCIDSVMRQIDFSNASISISTSGLTEGCIDGTTATTFTASFNKDGDTDSLYIWDFDNDGTTDYTSTSNTATHTYTATGNYDVTLTVKTANGCDYTTTSDKLINVATQPTIFSASIDSSEVCYSAGTTIYISYSSGTDSLLLNLPDNDIVIKDLTSGVTSYNYHYEFPDTGTYSIVVYAINNGCYSDPYTISNIHVNAPKALFSTKEKAFCDTYSVTFTNESSYSVSDTSTHFLWNFGDGTTSNDNATSVVHEYSSTGDYTVSLTVSNSSCSDTYSYTISIFSFDETQTGIIHADNTTGCRPLTVEFSQEISKYISENYTISSYEWILGDGTTISGTGKGTITYTYDQPGDYDVTLKVKGGCNYTITEKDFIHVYGPILDSLSYSPNPVCNGGEVSFKSNATKTASDNATSNTYSWDFGDGSYSGEANPTHTYTSSDTFNVSLLVTDNNGCSNTDSTEITIAPLEASFSLSADTVCMNSSVSFENLSSGTITQYKWDFNGDGTSDLTTTSATISPRIYSTPGDYKPSLTVLNSAGCSQTYSASLHVSDTTMSFTAAEIDLGCAPQHGQFYSEVNEDDVVSYYWQFGDEITSTEANPNIYFASPGYYDVSLTVTFRGDNNCTKTITKQKYIHVKGAYGNFTYDNTKGCSPNVVNLKVTDLESVSAIEWDFGNGETLYDTVRGDPDTLTTSYVYTELGSTNPYVMLYDSACDQPYSYSSDQEIYTSTPPKAGFTSDVLGICEGVPLQFNDTSTVTDPQSEITGWQWFINYDSTSSSIISSTVQDPTLTFTTIGMTTTADVTLIVTTDLGCSDTITQEDVITVYESDNLVADFTIDDSDKLFCAGQKVAFTSNAYSSNGDGTIKSYYWDLGDNTTANSKNTTHSYGYNLKGSALSVYHIATDAVQCTDTTYQSIYIDNLQATFVYDPQPVYRGGPVNFTDKSTSDTTITKYDWDFGSGTPSSATTSVVNDVVFKTITSGTTVQMIVTDDNSCKDTATVNFAVLNNPPTLRDTTITFLSNTEYTFTESFFTSLFSDEDPSQELDSIKIVTLPDYVTVKLNGVDVVAGQKIPVSKIDQLTLTPTTNWTGSTSMQWNGTDGIDFSDSPATIYISITPYPDPADLTNIEFTLPEDSVLTIPRDSFENNYSIGSTWAGLYITMRRIDIITLPDATTGTLYYQNKKVTADDTIAAIDIDLVPGLVFVPANGFSGTTSFEWSAVDKYNHADTALVIINYVNTPPVVVTIIDTLQQGETAIILKNTLSAHFSDKDKYDSPYKLELSDLPESTIGTFAIDGASVTSAIFSSITQITFTPVNTFEGTVTATLRISDGTDWGEAKIILVYKNTPPIMHDVTLDGEEDINLAFKATDFNTRYKAGPYEDADAADTLQSIKIVSLPVNGKIYYGTTPVTAGDEYSIDEISNLYYLTNQDSSGIDSFQYNGYDGTDWAIHDSTVFLNIAAVNDAPVAVNDTFYINEDNILTGVSVLDNDSDVDNPDSSLTVKVMYGLTAAQNGTIKLGTDGSLTYTPNENFNGSVSFTYLLCDNEPLCQTATVYIIIAGENDPPTARNNTYDIWDDETQSSFNCIKDEDSDEGKDFDVDGNSFYVYSIDDLTSTPVSGTFGSLEWLGNGSITYTLNANMDSLYKGETAIDTFTYRLIDDSLASDNSSVAYIIIRITGKNIPPYVEDKTYTTNEDVVLKVPISNGLLVGASDVDGDSFGVTAVDSTADQPVQGQIGKVTWAPEGSFVYTPDSIADTLSVGESLTEIFTFTVTDEYGGATTDTFKIVVTGVNDAPTAVNDTITRQEKQPAFTDNVLDNDYDIDRDTPVLTKVEGKNTGTTVDGDWGQLVAGSDGEYTYTPDSIKVATLDNGETAIDSFEYVIRDSYFATDTAWLFIYIIGSNDAPQPNPDLYETYEGVDSIYNLIPSNGILANDEDAENDTLTLTEIDGDTIHSITKTYGTLKWNEEGNFTFYQDTVETNSLKQDSVAEVTYIYTVSDGDATAFDTITIRIYGVNDAPVARDNYLTVSEDNVSVTIGTSNTSALLSGDYDPDKGDNIYVSTINGETSTTTVSGLGRLVWDSDGSYVYYTDSDTVSQLSDNESVVDSFLYEIKDLLGEIDTAWLYITIVGSNDDPVANNDTLQIYENDHTTTVSAKDGLLHNDNDPEHDHIISSIDGKNEGTITGTYGTLTWDSLGAYTYITDLEHIDTLSRADTVIDPFYYRTIDSIGASSGANLYIVIIGQNDPPTVLQKFDEMNEDDLVLTKASRETGILRGDKDVDGDSFGVYSINGDTTTLIYGKFGYIVWTWDGAFSYHLNYPGIDTLRYNESVRDTFVFVAKDTYPGMDDLDSTASNLLIIKIDGENDRPVAINDSIHVMEDQLTVSYTEPGQSLLYNDKDIDGDTITVFSVDQKQISPADAVFSKITWDEEGYFTYTRKSGVDTLPLGATLHDSIQYTIIDHPSGADSTAWLHIFLTGENDAPVAKLDTMTVYEDSDPVTSGAGQGILSNDSDIDRGDSISIVNIKGDTTFVTTGIYGTLTWDSTGTYTYTLDSAATDSLYLSEVVYDYFPYLITDKNGDTDTDSIKITIIGTNDAPVAVNDTFNITEDTPSLEENILSNDGDIDGDNFTTYSVTELTTKTLNGIYGKLKWNSDGSIVYEPNSAAVDSLQIGESATEEFTYTLADEHSAYSDTATFFIIIAGVNDAPVASDKFVQIDEDTDSIYATVDSTFALLYHDTDVDKDTLSVIEVNDQTHLVVKGEYGELHWDSTGAYTYLTNREKTDSLAVGDTVQEVFSYIISDPYGDTDTANLVIEIIGINDPPKAVENYYTVDEYHPLTVASVDDDQNIVYNDHDVDGITQTITEVNNTNVSSVTGLHGVLDWNSNGNFTYTPDSTFAIALRASETAIDTFSYSIADEYYAEDSSLIQFTILGQNNAPIAHNDTLTLSEDVSKAQKNIIDNDEDPDQQDTLTVVSIETDTNGSIEGNYGTLYWDSLGNVTYVPDTTKTNQIGPGSYEPETFIYTITDKGDSVSSAEIFVRIIGENDPFIAQNDTIELNEDEYANINVLANDTLDPDNFGAGNVDPSTMTVLTGPNHGRAVANTYNGKIFYQPDKNYYGPDTLEYRVCDTEGSCDFAWVYITVNPVNDPPVGLDTTIVVMVGETNTFDAFSRVTDIDDGIDKSTLEIVEEPLYGTFSLDQSSGSLSYTVATYTTDYDELIYSVKDIAGDTAYVTVTYLIKYTSSSFAQDDTLLTNEDTSVSYAVLANDTVGGYTPNPTSMEIKQQPSHGSASFDPSTRLLTYIPDADYYGSDQLTYTICPTVGQCDVATVYIEVTPVNDPVTISDDAAVTDENTSVNINVLDNDTDPEGMLSSDINLVSTPTNGTVKLVGDYVKYTPNTGFTGIDTFTYQVCDLDTVAPSCGSALVTVVVKSLNSSLDAENDSIFVYESDTAYVTVEDLTENDDVKFDTDKLVLDSFRIVQDAQYGTYVLNNAELSYSPETGYYGPDMMKYIIYDSEGDFDVADINIWVEEVNEEPIVRDDRYPVIENDYKRLNIMANDEDPDGTLLRSSLDTVTGPKYGTLTIDQETGTFLYKPNINTGNDSFTYTVCDDEGACGQATVTISINLGTSITLYREINEDTPDTIDLKSELEKINLYVNVDSIVAKTPASYGEVTLATSNTNLIYMPDSNYFGSDYYLLQIANDQGIDISLIVYVTIKQVDDAPVAVDDTITWAAPTTGLVINFNDILKNDYDVDDSIINLTQEAIDKGFTKLNVAFNQNDSTITITTDSIDWCNAWFTYEITDTTGLSDTAKVLLSPKLEGILANRDTFSVDENSSSNILDVLDNDEFVNNQRCTIDSIKVIEGPLHGNAEATASQEISYTPTATYYGKDSLIYQIVDIWGQADTAWVVITINEVNTPPVANPDTVDLIFGEPYVVNILNNDYDPDKDGYIDTSRTYVDITNMPQYGTIEIDTVTGTITYTSNYDNCTSDSFTYTIFDNEGDSASATVYITVPSTAPVQAIADTVYTYPGIEVEIDPLANDSGYFYPDYTYTLPTGGDVVVNGDYLTYTPNGSFAGRDSFIYTIKTPCGNTSSAYIFVLVQELRVPEIITPNGDGANDKLVIDGIENYPESAFQIYNRKGHIVYQKVGYDNSWDGFSNKGSLGGGKPLPAGSYFYTLVYNKGYNKQAGRIYIFR